MNGKEQSVAVTNKLQAISLVAERSRLPEHEKEVWKTLFDEARSMSKKIFKEKGERIKDMALVEMNAFVFMVSGPKDQQVKYFYFHGIILLLRLAWLKSLSGTTALDKYKHKEHRNVFVFNDIDSVVFEAYYEYLYTLAIERDVFELDPKEILHMAVYIKDPNFLVFLFETCLPKLMLEDATKLEKEAYAMRESKWNFFRMILSFEKYKVPVSLQVLYIEKTLLCNKRVEPPPKNRSNKDAKAIMRSADDYFMPGPVINTDAVEAFCAVMKSVVFELLKKASQERVKANYSKIERVFDTVLVIGSVMPKTGKVVKEESVFAKHWADMMLAFPTAIIEESHFMSQLRTFKPFGPNMFSPMIHFAMCDKRSEQIENDELLDDDFEHLPLEEEEDDDEEGEDIEEEEEEQEEKPKGKPLSPDRKRKHKEIDLRDTLSEDEKERKIKHVRTKKDREFVDDDMSDDESFVEEDTEESDEEDDEDE